MDAAARSLAELVSTAARHIAGGDRRAALANLQAAGAVDPNHLPLLFVTGLLAWDMGEYPKALHVLRLCAEQAPMNGTVAEVLASLHAQTGNLVESAYQGKLATALTADATLAPLVPPRFPSFDQAFRAFQKQPLFAAARRHAAQGNWRDALEQARQHLEIAPDDAEARHFYVEGLLRLGRGAAAIDAAAPLVAGTRPAPATASLYARALTSVGDFDEARRRHEEAAAAAPDDAAIAAARAVDAVWFGTPGEARTLARDWGARVARRHGQRRRPQGRLVVGYLVSHLADRGDAAAVGAVARAHDRSRTMVIGYGAGGQTWTENATLAGAFDKWVDVGALDAATLARTWASDGVDVMIDVGGLAGPTNLQALTLASAVRVAWLGVWAGLGGAIYDAAIVGASARPLPGEGLRLWTASVGAYPLSGEPSPARPAAGSGGCRFGADVRLCQLGPDTVALWSAILRSRPEAQLILRDNDMQSPANIDRLVRRFGRELAARIDIVQAANPRDFYAHVDVALTPDRGLSPRLAADALGWGVPVVALGASPYAALLGDLGLGELLVGESADAYVAKAVALAGAEHRARAAEQLRRAGERGAAGAREIAGLIEGAARELLAEAVA